ncbi:hypothetical protein OAM37_04680 [bacterium]|jgi:hypothetical protein|nr:hypothetical protein [Rubripirellula sp.]MDC0317807.1 hypothetical protein [bacterium]
MTETQDPSYYRCPVHEDHAEAVLCSRRRRLDVLVQETSIDGFTVLVKPQDADRLAIGRPWVLEYSGARVEVHGQWFFNSPDGHVQMGLRRLRDLTKTGASSQSFLFRLRPPAIHDLGFSGVIYSGLLLAVFLVLAMPGIGDALGTAPKIESAVIWLWSGVGNLVRGIK